MLDRMEEIIMKHPGPAEVLRATQKDEGFLDQLRGAGADIFQWLKGSRELMQWRPVIEACCDMAYYSLTTLSSYQTLGEEYSGIIQIANNNYLPSRKRRMCMILVHTWGPLLYCRLVPLLEKQLRDVSIWSKLSSPLGSLSFVLTLLQRYHVALFYLDGRFYHLAKRLANVQYVLVRPWMVDTESLYGFRLLAYITACHVTLTILHRLYSHTLKQGKVTKSEASTDSEGHVVTSSETSGDAVTSSHCLPSLRCSLCLDRRRNSSATWCGHLFCWECIIEWLQTKSQCPLCREEVLPSQIIPLVNYDQS